MGAAPLIVLPYPVSANRYWRHNRGRVMRSEAANAYRRTVAHAFYVAGWRQPIAGPVAVLFKLHPRLTKKGVASENRLDLDNCPKVVLDALQGVAFLNDHQVTLLLGVIDKPLPGGALSVRVKARR